MAKRVDKFNNSAKCERRKAERENRRRGKGKVSLKNNDKSKEKLQVQWGRVQKQAMEGKVQQEV